MFNINNNLKLKNCVKKAIINNLSESQQNNLQLDILLNYNFQKEFDIFCIHVINISYKYSYKNYNEFLIELYNNYHFIINSDILYECYDCESFTFEKYFQLNNNLNFYKKIANCFLAFGLFEE